MERTLTIYLFLIVLVVAGCRPAADHDADHVATANAGSTEANGSNASASDTSAPQSSDSIWSGPLGPNPEPIAWNDEGGVFQWQFPHDQRGVEDVTMVRAPVAASGSIVFVPLAGGPSRNGVAAVGAAASSESSPPALWVYKTRNPVLISPAATEDLMFFVDGQTGDQERHLHCAKIEDQQRAWRVPVANEASGMFRVGPEGIVVQDQLESVRFLNSDGQSLWQQNVGTLSRTPLLGRQHVCLVTGDQAATIHLLATSNGDPVARCSIEGNITADPVLLGDRLFVGTDKALIALDLSDKDPLRISRTVNTHVAGEIAYSDAHLAFVSGAGMICVVDRQSIEIVTKFPDGQPGYAPLISEERLLWIGEDGLYQASLSTPDESPTLWADLSWLGTPATSPVMYRKCLYLGIPKWGVVRFGLNTNG